MNDKRNKQIEGLRGLSILVIVFFHIIYQFHKKYLDSTTMNVFTEGLSLWGDFGILSFMAISVWFQYPLKEDQSSFFNVIITKIVRLWPTYAVSITFTYILTKFIVLPERTVNFQDYLLNLSLVNGFLDSNYVDGAHWYITTLIAITLCITLIEVVFKGNTFVYICWMLSCVVIHYLPPLAVMNRFLSETYVGVVVFIIMLKRIILENNNNLVMKKHKKDILAIFLSVGYTIAIRDFVYIIMLATTILLFLMCLYKKIKIFENKFILFVGMISYPLYLVHQNVSYIIQNQLMRLFGAYNIFFAGIAFLLVLILAILLYLLVEKPIQVKIKSLMLHQSLRGFK